MLAISFSTCYVYAAQQENLLETILFVPVYIPDQSEKKLPY